MLIDNIDTLFCVSISDQEYMYMKCVDKHVKPLTLYENELFMNDVSSIEFQQSQ